MVTQTFCSHSLNGFLTSLRIALPVKQLETSGFSSDMSNGSQVNIIGSQVVMMAETAASVTPVALNECFHWTAADVWSAGDDPSLYEARLIVQQTEGKPREEQLGSRRTRPQQRQEKRLSSRRNVPEDWSNQLQWDWSLCKGGRQERRWVQISIWRDFKIPKFEGPAQYLFFYHEDRPLSCSATY